ncbi:hypothetical protein [Brevundimonas sp. LM2]|uniref:hypothetical protein n=1 Tax=Brevundimonas sp. LM2 TaxID=1938605 RepID=UPI0012373886|nr:hypothetical protein [Brevundimonas sp. LM2]
MISSLTIAPVRRLGQSVHDLERASSAFAEWLTDEAASLGDEFVNPETGASFDVAIFKSGPRYGAIRADFRLRTAGLAGATIYGSFVRRVADDGYVLNIDGKE